MTIDPNSRLLPLNDMKAQAIPIMQGVPNSSGDDEKWDLKWLASVFRQRAFLMASVALSTALVAGAIIWREATSRPTQYSGQFQILVEAVTTEERQAQAAARAALPGSLRIDESSLDYDTQILVLKSVKLLNPIIQRLKVNYPNMSYGELTQNLDIRRVLVRDRSYERPTKLIQITYTDPDPQKLQAIVSELSKTYLQYSLKERQSSIRQGIRFIDSQLPQLRQRVDMLQKQVQALRERYTLFDPAARGAELSAFSATLDGQRSTTQTELVQAITRLKQLQQQLNNGNLALVLGEGPQQTLLSQYQTLEGQLAIESARLTPDNPALQALLDRRNNLQRLLQLEANQVLARAADQIEIAETRNQDIARTQANVKQQLRKLPQVARQYMDLQRELQLATDSLNASLSRREGLHIDAAQQEIPWELLAPPTVEAVPNVSNFNLLLLIAVLSILLGVGVGFLMEISQDVLRSPNEVKRLTQLPLLGVVPIAGDQGVTALTTRYRNRSSSQTSSDLDLSELLGTIHTDSNQNGHGNGILGNSPSHVYYAESLFTESIRSVYKNIRMLKGWDTPLRSLTISSAEPGDGKSTIATNLALVAAAMGQRVLLVDADLRKPQVHHLMNLANEHGLSDILSSNQDVQAYLQQVPTGERLTVLTAGQTALDPASALSSKKMRLLMEQFQMVFDLVIYDTPPLVGLADSSIIANHTDGLAMVVKLGKTRAARIKYALDEMGLHSTPVLGVIVNGSKETDSVLDDYYYRAEPEAVISN